MFDGFQLWWHNSRATSAQRGIDSLTLSLQRNVEAAINVDMDEATGQENEEQFRRIERLVVAAKRSRDKHLSAATALTDRIDRDKFYGFQ